ncbi:MraY family glycosyltransferase [Kordiimonas sp.]|uniref:MraY family glycosyltransferase n=1 Tax=Kordiimonas sp. TaxID=1970157 RepID=UPI003A8F75A2
MNIVFILMGALAVVLLGFRAQAIGRALGLLDDPSSEAHKFHANKTPLVGSILLAAGMVFLVVDIFISDLHREYLSISCFAGAMCVLGIIDDRVKLSWVSRFFTLWLIVAALIAVSPDLLISDLHWSWGMSTHLGSIAGLLFTALCLVGMVIALNMMDGFNGGILSQGIVWSLIFAVLSVSQQAVMLYLALVLGIIFAFNMAGRLFMGDGGAYALGLVMGASAILMYSTESTSPVYADTIVVWLALPVFDCLRVIFWRKLNGHSPFLPRRDHLHHLIMRRAGPKAALAYATTFTASSGVFALYFPQLSYLVVFAQLGVLALSVAILSKAERVESAKRVAAE